MKNIQWNNKNYKVLVDSTEEEQSNFLQPDIDFLRKNSEDSLSKRQLPLVEFNNSKVKVKFVGELITPNTNFISLPKNFTINEKNVDLTLKILNKYKDLKKDGNTLLSNFSFSYTKEGIESELFFFKKLKEFFLDYLTYEFIYPKKRIEIHSPRPIKNSKIDIVKTEREIGRKGPGITYKVKDIKNSDKWNLDDIYFTTLINLLDIYGSEKDREKITNMENFLKDEGYKINIIDINDDKVIDQIKKCETGIIHYPIVNTLIGYYDSKNVSDKYTVRAFYTKSFEYVWEYFSRIVFNYNDEFRKELNVEKLTVKDRDDKITEYSDIRPDVFSDYKGHRFIGDCKYYRNIDGDFYKEMYQYNIAFGNKYPMVILVPSMKTQRSFIRRHASYELFVIKVSIEEVINDVVSDTKSVISKVHRMLESSSRWEKSKTDNISN
jgi:hypothetical protein